MTLITFVLTDEYVVLASDRRITLARGTKVISQDDKAVKSVLLNGQMLLGFTGVAELHGKPMLQWLGEHLIGVHPNDIPEVLRDLMTDYYKANRSVRALPHAFIAAGYAFDPLRFPAAWPMGFRVSNTANVVRGARMEFSHPSTDFASTRFALGNQRQMVGAVGYPYSNTALRSLEGSVRLALRLDASDPSKVFWPVIGFMRGVAERSAGYVGDTIVITAIPRSSIPIPDIPGFLIPLTEGAAFGPTRAPTSFMVTNGRFDPETYLPGTISPHMVTMGATFGPAPFGVAPGPEAPVIT